MSSRSLRCTKPSKTNDNSKHKPLPVRHNSPGQRISLDALNVPAYPSKRSHSSSSSGPSSTKSSPNIRSNRNEELGHRKMVKSCTSPSLIGANRKVPRSPGNSSSSSDRGKPSSPKTVSIYAEVRQTSTKQQNLPSEQFPTSHPRLAALAGINGLRSRLMSTGQIPEEPAQEEQLPTGISRPRLMTTGGIEDNSRNGPKMCRSNTSNHLGEGQIKAIELPTARKG